MSADSISALSIQSILGVQSSHSTPGERSNPGLQDIHMQYAEPLVHSALFSGSFSDPMVREYRAKSIFEDLKRAKEAFVRDTVHEQTDGKIAKPKMLYDYGKDMSLGVEGMVEMIGEHSPSKVIQSRKRVSAGKKIEWIPYSSSFRYVIYEDLVGLKPVNPCRRDLLVFPLIQTNVEENKVFHLCFLQP